MKLTQNTTELSQLYFLTCEQTIVRSFSKNATKESKARICLQAYSIYQRLQTLKYEKHASHFFGRVLKQCFAMIVGVQEIGNVSKERVLKFYCDLRGIAERQTQPPNFSTKSSLHQPKKNAPISATTTAKIGIPSSSSAKTVLFKSTSAVPPKIVEPSTCKPSSDMTVVKHSVNKILTDYKAPGLQPLESDAAAPNAKLLAVVGDQRFKMNSADGKIVSTNGNPPVKNNSDEISRKPASILSPIGTQFSKLNTSLQPTKKKSEQYSLPKNSSIAPPTYNASSSFQQNSIESILRSAMTSTAPSPSSSA
uniref:Uncharacterized protein n=1 Tax=Romanomermis culicivorax TaxID=13658 RepID=A0A915J4H5_ROMCU